MASLLPDDVVSRSRAQVVSLPDGRLLVRHGGGLSVLAGLSIADVRRIVSRTGDGRRAEELSRAMADEEGLSAGAARRRLATLAGDVLAVRRAAGGSNPAARGSMLVVVGGGPAASRLVAGLESGPPPAVEVQRVPAARFPSCRTPEFLAGEERTVLPGDGSPAGLDPAAEAADLETRLASADLVACALEGVPWRALWDVQHACWTLGVPALFLTLDPDGARVGPAVVPGVTPCLACAQAASFESLGETEGFFETIAHFRTERLRAESEPVFGAARAALVREAREVLAADGRPRLIARVVLVTAGGRRREYAVRRRRDCPICSRPAGGPRRSASALVARAERALVERFETGARNARAGSSEDPRRVRAVGIVGGGTAGYLAALALRIKRPELSVTLIESSAVPVIGVGEATTPLMPQFLHADLGLDVHQLFREVLPTFKLGIRFAWDGRGSHFNYPFGPVRVLEPWVYDGDVRRCSLRSMTMSAGVLPGALDTATAYHLDNRRFVRYLRARAAELGVETVDARIADVELSEDGGEVRRLRSDDGRSFEFDFYLDCSGFRSLLLEKALGSPFVSYRPSLAADRAIVATVPLRDGIAPYTLAEAMDAGWCWSTPQRDGDHRGYVFCSEFLSPEAAEEEMRRKNPGMGEARQIAFRAGRHEHFWQGNVVALGNAYGFVEPLESTALHMLIRQIGLLCRAFPVRRREPGVSALLNRRVNGFWDYLRWFLAIHYRFNRGLETPFWHHCREHADVSSHRELLDAFTSCGPLSYDPRLSFEYPDPLWGAEGVDVLLLGQRVPARMPRPEHAREAWLEHAGRCERAVAAMAPHDEVLEDLDRRPELLERFAAAFRSVGPAFPVKGR